MVEGVLKQPLKIQRTLNNLIDLPHFPTSIRTQVQEANRKFYKKQKAAEAILYEKEKEAKAHKAIAEAAFYTRRQAANGELYTNQKEAEGLVALAQAQGTYLSTLLSSLGGNYAALRDYLMINGGIYQEIAKIDGEAVRGLQPKISIWSNGMGVELVVLMV